VGHAEFACVDLVVVSLWRSAGGLDVWGVFTPAVDLSCTRSRFPFRSSRLVSSTTALRCLSSVVWWLAARMEGVGVVVGEGWLCMHSRCDDARRASLTWSQRGCGGVLSCLMTVVICSFSALHSRPQLSALSRSSGPYCLVRVTWPHYCSRWVFGGS